MRSAHEPLVRFFEPLTLGPLDAAAADGGDHEPLDGDAVRFDDEVVAEIVELSGGRPYYLQKLAYFAFDAATVDASRRRSLQSPSSAPSPRSARRSLPRRWAAMSADRAPGRRRVVALGTSRRPSGEIEAEAAPRDRNRRRPVRRFVDLPLTATSTGLANGQRGRYAVSDRLFRRYLELQACEP